MGAALTPAEIRQRLRARHPGREGEELVKAFDGLYQDIQTLKAWGNALATKLNADAGVTDTNYAQTGL